MSLLLSRNVIWWSKCPNLLTFTSHNVLKNNFTISNILYETKKLATFEDVKAVKCNKNTLLVDVREPVELQETGVLPGSINIPLGEVESVLKDMPSKEFEKRYGNKKPDPDYPIIFSCRAGIRSEKAQDIAIRLGYKDVRNYVGGWLDWEERNKPK